MNYPSRLIEEAVSEISRLPGIGKKTAERIIVDLHGKVLPSELSHHEAQNSSIGEEIIQALVSLGYPRHHVLQRLKKMPETLVGEEAIIKYFLQNA